MPAPIITLTSDFGLSDSYVAEMKAAVLTQCPAANLIDITHLITPQDILYGSIIIERAVATFPRGTIHLAVIDPGVGTNRRLLIAQIKDQFIICPDNGLITWAWRRHGGGSAFELTWRATKIAPTFHGRDILGPAAGLLAAGKLIEDLAAPIDNPFLLNIAPAELPLRRGQIIHVDHFGNAISNITQEAMEAENDVIQNIQVGDFSFGLPKQTYQDVPTRKPLALFSSSGLLEIAVRDGSAAKLLKIKVGDEITIELNKR